MPALRAPLVRAYPWLALALVSVLAVGLDLSREPGSQVLGALYVQCVRAYQAHGRPILAGQVVCRYSPTCSEYSIAAVQRHGLARGLSMTVDRLTRCGGAITPGTADPPTW